MLRWLWDFSFIIDSSHIRRGPKPFLSFFGPRYVDRLCEQKEKSKNTPTKKTKKQKRGIPLEKLLLEFPSLFLFRLFVVSLEIHPLLLGAQKIER